MKLDRQLLYRIFGYRAGFLHGDPLMLDRWLWLRRRLPETANGERLLDVGCGSGAFTIGAARRGYEAVGGSWSEQDLDAAAARARLSGADRVTFVRLDARELGKVKEWKERFHIVVCLETIEHILDDRALVCALADCLVPGGRLLLTTPYLLYPPMTPEDKGPFQREELGWHVRRGYSPAMLRELCAAAGLLPEEISYCGGFLSQKGTWLMRRLARWNLLSGWTLSLPFRLFAYFLDRWVAWVLEWPSASICLEAYKPRYGGAGTIRRDLGWEADRSAKAAGREEGSLPALE